MTYQPPPGYHAQPPRHPPATPGHHPPVASLPPGLAALQGQLRNPVPVMVAAAGVVLTATAFFLPLASYSFGSDGDVLREMFYLPGNDPNLYLSLDRQQAVIPLVLTVAVTLALSGSRRWLHFGKLACLGLGGVGIAAAVSAAHTWQQKTRALLESSSAMIETGPAEDESSSAQRLIDKADIAFGPGVWVLVAGIVTLVVAVMLVKAPTRQPYPMPVVPGPPRPDHPVMPPRPAATAPPPVAPAPSPPTAPTGNGGGDRDIVVHDDPPSLSIYKPPKKDA